MTGNAALVINVEMKNEAGVYYASSSELPGLHVCGESLDATCNNVVEAVKALFKFGRDMNVRVTRATTDLSSFPHGSPGCNRFVIEYLSA